MSRSRTRNASDTFPCWLGDAIFFLSDRAGTMNLFRYDPKTQAVAQQTFHEDFDVRSLTSGAGRLAYEQGGRLHVFDPESGQTRDAVDRDRRGPALHPPAPPEGGALDRALRPVAEWLPRRVAGARGDPDRPGQEGRYPQPDQHDPAICERDPAWSPDGQSIAYFSDASGEYELVVADQRGVQKRLPAGRALLLDTPVWSPDSQRIAYTDKALNLHYLTLETGAIVTVDTDSYDHPVRSLDPGWSPDSQWLVYTKRLANHLRAVFLFELASGQIHQGQRRHERRDQRLLQPGWAAALLRGQRQLWAEHRLAGYVLV